MADVAVTDLTIEVTNQDTVTSNGLGPASPGSARSQSVSGGTRCLKTFHGTITIPSSALTYATGGVPISGVTSSLTGAVVAGNGLACPGLGCPTELVELEVEGETEVTTHKAEFVRGVPGTAPHKLKLFVVPGTPDGKPLAEVANATALNDATAFPGAPTILRVVARGY